ncbi:MAG: RNA polymerase sigma factor [Thermoleophilaceae bacterium]
MEAQDGRLVQRAAAGDTGAFATLVERHSGVVYRVAARIVGPDEADDVSQDALIRAYHRLGQYRGDSPFRSWLLRITHNAALDSLAKRRPTPVGAPGAPAAGSDAPEDAPAFQDRGPDTKGPVSRLEDRERRERLALKLTELRPEHRAVLVLRDLEGLAYDEIAEVTASPVGSVKGRLHRARGEMVEIMRNNTYDWELPE